MKEKKELSRDEAYAERLSHLRKALNIVFYILEVICALSALMIIIAALSQHDGSIMFGLFGSIVSGLLIYIGYLFLLARIDYIETTEFMLIALEKKNKEEKDNKDKAEENEIKAE